MDIMRKPAWGVVCALTVLALVGCAEEQPHAPAAVAPAASPAKTSAALLEVLGGPVDQPDLQAYVTSLGRRLDGDSPDPHPTRFVLVRSARLNAFAAPDGGVVLCAGLLDALPRERALAAVLAHEIGHVRAGHVGAMLEVHRCEPSPARQEALQLLERRFTPAQEHQADTIALHLLARAGIDPRGLAEALTVLQRHRLRCRTAALSRPGTHPLTMDRIRRIHRLTLALAPVRLAEPPERTRKRFHAMQRRLTLWRSSADGLTRRTALRE